MKQKKIPEHQLNVTATVDQAIENMTKNKSNGWSNAKIESRTIHSNEAK